MLLQSALLNEAYELILRYFALYSSTIGFPELAYPSLVRVSSMRQSTIYLSLISSNVRWSFVLQLRKVCKSVSFSWLRLQLKQLIEKVGVRVSLQFVLCDWPVSVNADCSFLAKILILILHPYAMHT